MGIKWKSIGPDHWTLRALFAVCLAAVVLYFALAFILSRSAGYIFNKTVNEQHVLQGHLSVEGLSANVWGTLKFTNLVWLDKDGNQILLIPKGKVKVDTIDLMTDLVMGHVGASVIEEVDLKGATLNLDFNDNMQVDLVTEKEVQAKEPRKTQVERQAEWENKLRNLNWGGQFIEASLKLEDCLVNVRQKGRYYSLQNVNGHIDINTHKFVKLDLSTGKFSGDAIGDAIQVKGTIHLPKETDEAAQIDTNFNFYAVDPSSLGFGDIHDTMTLTTHWTGTVSHPVAQGYLVMPILRIPALTFTGLTGDVTYEDGLMTFSNVRADVFGGRLWAQGTYNLDSRAYTISGKAKRLISSEALHDPDFDVFVNANITVESDGDSRHTHAYGDFTSSPGRYMMIPIEKITGRFDHLYKQTDFYDVRIQTKYTDFYTDALTIDHGQLKLGHLNLLFSSGDKLDLNRETLLADRKLLENAKDSLGGLSSNADDIKRNISDMKDGQKEISDVWGQSKSLKHSLDGLKDTIDRLKNLKNQS